MNKIRSKVVGLTFVSPPWERMQVGDYLEVVRQPDNPADPNAIRLRHSNQDVGFIKKELAADIAPHIDEGVRVEVVILDLTARESNREPGKVHRGCNIEIRVHKDGGEYFEGYGLNPQATQEVPDFRGKGGTF